VGEKIGLSVNRDHASSSNLAAGIFIITIISTIIVVFIIISISTIISINISISVVIIMMNMMMMLLIEGKEVFATTLRQLDGELAHATLDSGLSAGR